MAISNKLQRKLDNCNVAKNTTVNEVMGIDWYNTAENTCSSKIAKNLKRKLGK